MLHVNSREVQSSHRIKLECLQIKGVAHVDNFLDSTDLLKRNLFLRNKSLLATCELDQNAATHNSGDFATDFSAHFDIANRILNPQPNFKFF